VWLGEREAFDIPCAKIVFLSKQIIFFSPFTFPFQFMVDHPSPVSSILVVISTSTVAADNFSFPYPTSAAATNA